MSHDYQQGWKENEHTRFPFDDESMANAIESLKTLKPPYEPVHFPWSFENSNNLMKMELAGVPDNPDAVGSDARFSLIPLEAHDFIDVINFNKTVDWYVKDEVMTSCSSSVDSSLNQHQNCINPAELHVSEEDTSSKFSTASTVVLDQGCNDSLKKVQNLVLQQESNCSVGVKQDARNASLYFNFDVDRTKQSPKPALLAPKVNPIMKFLKPRRGRGRPGGKRPVTWKKNAIPPPHQAAVNSVNDKQTDNMTEKQVVELGQEILTERNLLLGALEIAKSRYHVLKGEHDKLSEEAILKGIGHAAEKLGIHKLSSGAQDIVIKYMNLL